MKIRKRNLNRANMKSRFNKTDPFIIPAEAMLISEGYIKAHLEGKTLDHIDLNETIVATKYEQDKAFFQNSFWIDHESNDKIVVHLNRFANYESQKQIYLRFTIDGKICSNESISVTLGNKTDFDSILLDSYQFLDTEINPNPHPITNLKFDPVSHDISGEFSFKIEVPSPLSLSGEFKVKLLQRATRNKVILWSGNEYPF